MENGGIRRWKSPNQVYLLRDTGSQRPLYKIGASSNPERRRRNMASQFKTTVELIAAFRVPGATLIEEAWHRFFESAKAAQSGPRSREWFYLTESEVSFFCELTPEIEMLERLDMGNNTAWFNMAMHFGKMQEIADRFRHQLAFNAS